MKICIILPKELPVPCVKGGAIEELMTDIIDENEIEKKLDITLVSIYDEKAKEESKKYKHTKFIYIQNDFKYKVKGLIVRILNLFSKAKYNTYNEVTLDKIKNEDFDYIIVEDGAFQCFKSYTKHFDKEKLLIHFHHNGKSNKETDATYSTYVGVSEFVAKTFSDSSSIKDIKVLKNGINSEKFDREFTKEQRAEIRNKFGYTDDDFVIIFCGRLIKEKGILELVKAVKQIKESNIKLLVIGSINFGNHGTSEYLTELEKEVETSAGKVKLTGYIDNRDLYKYYKSADIGIVPSVYEDPAPLTVIEIMYNKLPLIVTNTGGAPEYIASSTIMVQKEGDLIQSLKENIIKLYKDKDLRLTMSKDSYTQASKFTTKHFYRDFVNIFNEKATKGEKKNG